jgi:hypothetical protein
MRAEFLTDVPADWVDQSMNGWALSEWVGELLLIATVWNDVLRRAARLWRIILSATKMFPQYLMKLRDPYQKLLSKRVPRGCAQCRASEFCEAVLSDSDTWLTGLNEFVADLRTFLRDMDEILHEGPKHSDL